MKHLYCSFSGLLACFVAIAQQPVSWQYSAKKIATKTYKIRLTATIHAPWHIYSQTTPGGGPLPTKIVFTKNRLFIAEGTTKEVGKLLVRHEDAFGVDVKQFSNKVEFVQVIKTHTDNIKTTIKGTIDFMICTDEQCLPPITVNFSIALVE